MFNQNIKSPVNIPVSKIRPFEGNPYKVLDNEEMNFLIIESIEIFKEEQPDGRLLKCINFKFPVFYDGDENVTHICWDSETTVETVVLLSGN